MAMKWTLSFLLAGSILLQQSSCRDDPPKPLTELDKLPAETQTGKQKLGCLINGKAFVPNSTVDVYAVFQQGILQVSGETDRPANPYLEWISIILIENNNILEPGTYDLNSPPYQAAKCYFKECYY